MEDKFDKILSNKIRELSDNNEIPYNPEHWNMLLKHLFLNNHLNYYY